MPRKRVNFLATSTRAIQRDRISASSSCRSQHPSQSASRGMPLSRFSITARRRSISRSCISNICRSLLSVVIIPNLFKQKGRRRAPPVPHVPTPGALGGSARQVAAPSFPIADVRDLVRQALMSDWTSVLAAELPPRAGAAMQFGSRAAPGRFNQAASAKMVHRSRHGSPWTAERIRYVVKDATGQGTARCEQHRQATDAFE